MANTKNTKKTTTTKNTKSKTAPKKSTRKPKNMAKVPVTTSDKATAKLSAELDKIPRDSADVTAAGKKSIASKTVALKTNGPFPVLRWVILIPLAVLAFFFKFCVAGYSFSALVCLCLMGVILFYNLIPLWARKSPKPAKVVKRIFTILLCIGLLVVGVTECLIIRASFGSSDTDFQYLVVLGAKVRSDRPSLSLMNRIDAAYDYLTEHPDTIAIVTGGQGVDEPTTEAQCMYDHLTARGIDPSRIWMEDKATSTWENLHFSLDLIEENTGTRPEKIGVLSSEYHLFRASLFAKECGVEFVDIPAKTTILSLKINYFMREVAGVWHYILLGGQYHD
ncbi:MAG: YdcF family protein [Oscillospiraceae bacterium]|nr:YdcF family protein [Oscillospiraceae bacterium]